MARVCSSCTRLVLPVLLILAVPSTLQSLWGTSTLSMLSQLPGPPPLRVAVQNMWSDTAAVLAEMEVLLAPVAWAATGRALVAVNVSLSQDEQLVSADVILFGSFGDRARSGEVAIAHGHHALTIFISSENYAAYADSMVPDVHVAFGHRRDITACNYLRMPWWLPLVLDASTPRWALPSFSPLLRRELTGHAWFARPRAAALLSSHYAFPRRELFRLLTSLGLDVDAPNKAFHNMEWPAGLSTHIFEAKIEFLESYRYNICPENGRTGPGGGYSTEKAPHAFMAGAVPIYWGDAFDEDVFNPARVIFFDAEHSATVVQTIKRLEADTEFRDEWFSKPVLMPGADLWLQGWVDHAARLWKGQGQMTRGALCSQQS